MLPTQSPATTRPTKGYQRQSRIPVTAALLVMAVLVAMALLAPVAFPGNPLAITGGPLIRPFQEWAHPLGTDRLGRDVLACLVHGARGTLAVAALSALLTAGLGIGIGTLAGGLGPMTDAVLMRITDAMRAIPGFILALAFVSALGPQIPVIALAVALAAWPPVARVVRAEVTAMRARDFVAACIVTGMSPLRIAFREILPNTMAPATTLSAVTVATAILVETALSFLGIADQNRPSWGAMIAEARPILRTNWYLSAFPGLMVMLAVLSLNLLADALNSRLAIRQRA